MADLDKMTTDELEALLKHPEKLAELEAEPEAPAPAPEPTPEPEPEPEKAPEEPAPAEPAKEPEPEVDYEKERLRLLLEEMEARQKAMDSKLGKYAGEADYWRKQAERAKARPEPAPEEPSAFDPEERPRPAPAPSRDATTSYVIGLAVNQAAFDFAASHPDAKDMAQEIQQYWIDTGYDAQRALLADDPIEARKESYRALDEAYWHVSAARRAKARTELDQKRTEQFTRAKEAKQRAGISASGSAPPPRAPAKTLNDMTTEELEKELKRLTR